MAGQRPGGGTHQDGVLAVDLGGTWLRVGAARPDGRLIARATVSTPQDGPDSVVAAVKAMAAGLAGALPAPRAVGVAAPGPLDPATGTILATPNLRGFEGYPLGERLSASLELPVHVQNDASLAALGEYLHGAGQGTDLLVYLTVSTGVGGGLVRNGRLETGVHGLGAEFGHIVVAGGGRACSFGHSGCLEALASGTAIASAAIEAIASGVPTAMRSEREDLRLGPGSGSVGPTAVDVARAAQNGDALALEIMERAGHYLGIGIGGLINAYDPDLVVVGGGVAESWALLAEPLRVAASSIVMCRLVLVEGAGTARVQPDAVLAQPPGRTDLAVRIARAATGDDAGLLGAAAWALSRAGTRLDSV